MKLFNFLSRVRSAFESGWADPAARYGANYVGWYDVSGSRAFGGVREPGHWSNRPPLEVVVLNNGAPVGSTKSFEQRDDGIWAFEADVGREFDPDDILKDRLKVVALDRLGGQSPLNISGATQLRCIQALNSSPPPQPQDPADGQI